MIRGTFASGLNSWTKLDYKKFVYDLKTGKLRVFFAKGLKDLQEKVHESFTEHFMVKEGHFWIKLNVGEQILRITLQEKMKLEFAEMVTYEVTSVNKKELKISLNENEEDSDLDAPEEFVMKTKDKDEIKFGRGKDNPWRIKCKAISSKHA